MSKLHSVEKREKKVNINSLTPDQLVQLSGYIGSKTTIMIKKAKAEIQSLLDIYGLKLVLQYSVVPAIEENKDEEVQQTENTDKI